MEQMIAISVKIPKRLKERMKKSHMKASKIVRELLEQKMMDEEVKKLSADIKKQKKIFDKLSIEAVVEDLRNDRYKVH